MGLYESSLSRSFLILGGDIRGPLRAAGASIIPLGIDRWTCPRKSSRPRERHVRWFTSWDLGTCHASRHSNLSFPSYPASLFPPLHASLSLVISFRFRRTFLFSRSADKRCMEEALHRYLSSILWYYCTRITKTAKQKPIDNIYYWYLLSINN